jgi:hypothetical protein
LDELAAESGRQPGLIEVWPAYLAVVAGSADPHQDSGPPKPTATGSGIPEPDASLEADCRRMYLEDLSGLLCNVPAGTIPDATMDTSTVVSAGERHKTPIYVSDVTDTRGFLSWLRG